MGCKECEETQITLDLWKNAALNGMKLMEGQQKLINKLIEDLKKAGENK